MPKNRLINGYVIFRPFKNCFQLTQTKGFAKTNESCGEFKCINLGSFETLKEATNYALTLKPGKST